MSSENGRGIILSDTIETSALFSDTQKKVLVRRSLKYLQDERIPVNPGNMQFASGVVLDALRRGLAQSDKAVPGQKESLAKYLTLGFEERKLIFLEGRQVVSEIRHQSPRGKFLGAWAIPRELVEQGEGEIQYFAQTPSLNTLSEICLISRSRQEALDDFLGLAISSLPESLQDNAKKRNFNELEKSKLVRNMLLSIGFRGNKNPIISLDDLAKFTHLFRENPDQYLGENRFEAVKLYFEINGLDLDEIKDAYLQDLWRQMQESFESNASISLESKDILYQRFDPTLLLLHPALEEVPIITDRGRIESGLPSLWDESNSVEIMGHLIPNKEILMAARAQSRARGYEQNALKMQTAMSYWDLYRREKQALPDRLSNLDEWLASEKKRALDLRAHYPAGFEPRSLAQLQFLRRQVLQDLNPARNRLGTDRRLLEDSRDNRNRVVEYYEQLTQQPENFIEITRGHYLRGISRESAGLSISITAQEARIGQKTGLIEGLVSGQFSQVASERVIEQIRTFSKEPELLIKELENLLGMLKNDSARNIFRSDSNTRALKTLVMAEISIASWESGRRREVGFYGQGQLSAKMRSDEFKIKNFNDPVVLNTVSISIINRLINLNKMVQEARVKRNEADERQREIGLIRRELRENPDKPLPNDALKDFNAVREMMIEAVISSVPDNLTPEQLEKVKELVELDADLLRRLFPKEVSLDGFRVALGVQIPILEQDVAKRLSILHSFTAPNGETLVTPRNHRQTVLYNQSKTRLESARIFSKYLSDPLLDLDLANGISKSKYFDLLKLRIYKFRRYLQQPSLIEEVGKLSSNLQTLDGEIELRNALNRVTSLKRQINDLKQDKSPEMKIVQRMGRLGLAVKLEPEVN